MKFIESFTEAKNKKTSEYFFDAKGSIISDNTNKIWAKRLSIELGDNEIQNQYFIRTYNNMPLDPIGPEAGRDIWRRTELKSVSEKTFDYYILYLRSKNGIYMTRTQRSFING